MRPAFPIRGAGLRGRQRHLQTNKTPYRGTHTPLNGIQTNKQTIKTHKRTFGQYSVEVTGDKVAIVGNSNSNFGHFYETNFERFKAHATGAENDWNRPQILGMDWGYGLTGTIQTWLYGLVLNDKIEA